MIPSVVGVLGDTLGRDEAREAAERELSKQAYRDAEPPWVYRVLQWVLDQLSEALSKVGDNLPGGGGGLLVLFLLVVGLVALLLTRLRPVGGRSQSDLFTGGPVLTAEDHRRRAEQAAEQQRWADAVRERLRAVARELESRGVVDPRPGRTADELAGEVGAAMPSLAEPLARGTRVFDDVWYGGRPADASTYAVLVEVDRVVQSARPVPA